MFKMCGETLRPLRPVNGAGGVFTVSDIRDSHDVKEIRVIHVTSLKHRSLLVAFPVRADLSVSSSGAFPPLVHLLPPDQWKKF